MLRKSYTRNLASISLVSVIAAFVHAMHDFMFAETPQYRLDSVTFGAYQIDYCNAGILERCILGEAQPIGYVIVYKLLTHWGAIDVRGSR